MSGLNMIAQIKGIQYPLWGRFERVDNPKKVVGLSSLFFRRTLSCPKIGHLLAFLFFGSEENSTKVVGCLVKFTGNCRIYMVP